MKNYNSQGPKKKNKRKLVDADDVERDRQHESATDPSIFGFIYYESEKEERERLESEKLQSQYDDD